MFVGVGVYADGRDAEFARAARHAHRDLAAVGDQQPGDHFATQFGGRRSRNARNPSWPSDDVRRAAMARDVMPRVCTGSASLTSAMSRFAAAMAAGPAVANST